MPVLHTPTTTGDVLQCDLVPIAQGLLPYFRILFDSLRYRGAWVSDEDFNRARRYLAWQEAMLLCSFGKELVDAIDRNTLAVNAINTSMLKLDTIATAIAGIDPCCPELITATNAIATAIATKECGESSTGTVPDQMCCPEFVHWEAIYNCETGEVEKWIGDDGTVIDGPDSPPPRYRDVPNPPVLTEPPVLEEVGPGKWVPHPGTEVASPQTADKCRKANWAVYAIYQCLLEMDTTFSNTVTAIKWFSRIVGVSGLLGGVMRLKPGTYDPVQPASELYLSGDELSKAAMKSWGGSVIGIIWGIIGWIGRNSSFTIGFQEAQEDLVRAIYCSTSPTNLLSRWNAAVDAHFQSYAPQGMLIKYLMNRALANNLSDSNLEVPEDQPRFAVDCSCPPPADTNVRRVTINGYGEFLTWYPSKEFWAVDWLEDGQSTLGTAPNQYSAVLSGTSTPCNIFRKAAVGSNAQIKLTETVESESLQIFRARDIIPLAPYPPAGGWGGVNDWAIGIFLYYVPGGAGFTFEIQGATEVV